MLGHPRLPRTASSIASCLLALADQSGQRTSPGVGRDPASHDPRCHPPPGHGSAHHPGDMVQLTFFTHMYIVWEWSMTAYVAGSTCSVQSKPTYFCLNASILTKRSA
eukprot:2607571-Amphidinium_carterae.1